MKVFIRLAIVAVLSIVPFGFSHAQTSLVTGANQTAEQKVTLPDPLTPDAVRGLVSTLSDEQVRSLLLERLDAVAKKQTEESSSGNANLALLIESWITGVVFAVGDAIQRVPLIWDGLKRGINNFVGERGLVGGLQFVGVILGAMVVGSIAEFIVNYLTRNRRRRINEAGKPATLHDTLAVLGTRLFLDMIALVAFFMVTRVISKALIPADVQPIAAVVMVNLVVIPRLAAAVSRFLVAPNRPDLRLMSADDETAKYFHRNQVGIFVLVGISIFINKFQAMNGVEMGETRLGFWLNAAIFVWLGIMTVRLRHEITKLLIGNVEDATPVETRIARIFPWFSLAAIIVMWLFIEILASQGRFDLLQGGRHFITLGLVLFAPVLDTMIRGLVRRLLPPMSGEGVVAQQAYHSTKRSYIRIGRLLMFGLVIVIIAAQWDIDFENLASAGLGARFAGRFLEVLMILATGYLVWEVATLFLNRKLAAEQTAAGFDLAADEPGGGEGGGQGGSRLSTVLPMLRFTLQIGIITMTILIALGNMGIDITPLLAGAGIVGIAIGFGAQTLVRDVVSGVFFLIDDAFRVGEYLVIDDTVGTVEKISLRSLQLRHHNGPIHTIPYGEIPKVTNNSRDWVIVKLKWTVPFGTDVGKIKRLFKQIGKEMLETEYAGDLIQTFKSQGVYDVDDVGVVIRGKFMAKPGTQWIIRKDVFQRVQAKLEENGIEFARREVRVQIPGMDDANGLNDQQKQAVGAAAGTAVQTAIDKAAQAPKADPANAQ